MYEGLISNIGDNYNSYSYICPIDGIYMISSSVLTTTNGSALSGLNKGQKGLSWQQADDIEGRNHASNTVIFECYAGEKVWPFSSGASSIEDFRYSVFSGALLQYL